MRVPFKKYFLLLKDYLVPFKKTALLLAFFMLANVSLGIFNPLVLEYFLANVQSSETLPLVLAASLFTFLALLQQVFLIFATYLSSKLAWSATNLLRYDLAKHCMYLDMSFHNKYKTGELIERIDGDISTLATFFSTMVFMVLINFMMVFGVLAVMFIKSWILGLSFLGYTIIILIILFSLRRIATPYFKKNREATANLFGFLEEAIEGTEDIKASGAIPAILRRFHFFSREEFYANYKAWLAAEFYVFVMIMMDGIGNVIVFLVGIPTEIPIATLFIVSNYAIALIGPLIRISWQFNRLQEADANIERISELFAIGSKLEDTGNTPIPSGSFSVEFSDLSFSYVENEPVLRDVNFTLSSERTLGLVGRTGSGKSTLSRLVFRLYDPFQGAVKLSGVNVRDYPLRSLREKIAYITQNVELFPATIRENITFFDSSIPDEEIIAVLKNLELEDWFNRLPNGLDTKILSENGGGLSAGEAQLLALTRAFLKEPQLVIMDEASSRLDPATERLIDKAFSKLLEGRTAIIIAHRLSTLHSVDEILILEEGRIAEHGNRQQLECDKRSLYSQLLQKGMEEVLH